MSPDDEVLSEPALFVVDASVAIKLFLDEPLKPQARALFEQVVAGPSPRLLVPDLFFVECANILWKWVRRFGYAADQARDDLADVMRLPITRFPTTELVEDALQLAVSHEISAYDACYVALSRRENAPLVTADEKLVRKLAGAEPEVRWLGDMAGGPSASTVPRDGPSR